MSKQYRYSETFLSLQGEGHYTGVPTVWYRTWGCNFECGGFGQANPEDPTTWVLDHKKIDVSKYNTLEELPVWKRGCDSSYSWSKKFAHLSRRDTPEGITKTLIDYLPGKVFSQPNGTEYHLAFTGGEPMMSQSMMIDVLTVMQQQNNMPKFVTIETNGTQAMREPFRQFMTPLTGDWDDPSYGFIPRRLELFFSVSPKLYLSGEKWGDAIKPDVVAGYRSISDKGQLKYVCDNTQKAWDQVEKATDLYRKHGVEWPVWIMPVGGLREDQEKIQREVADSCLERGYNFSPRMHCFIWGNQIGT